MEDDDFNNIVKTSWEAGVYRGSADIVLKNKLKKLKSDVKVGWNIKSQESNRRKLEIQSFLADWNSKAKSGLLSSYDRHKRDEFLMDLHILNQKKRLSLADDGANISLLQYANDALFFGLKINLSKSRLFSIGVPEEEVMNIARAVNCSYGSLPFFYLGLPVGKDMNRIEAWSDIVNRFTKKLSSWKANLLSIGG
ncbi:hypothetical protein Tco_0197138, partial [Tanacetum coccineum]